MPEAGIHRPVRTGPLGPYLDWSKWSDRSNWAEWCVDSSPEGEDRLNKPHCSICWYCNIESCSQFIRFTIFRLNSLFLGSDNMSSLYSLP